MMHCVEGNRFSTRHVVGVCLHVCDSNGMFANKADLSKWLEWGGSSAGGKNTLWFTTVHKTYTHAALDRLWFCNCLLLYISNTWPRTPATWTFGPRVEFTPHPWLRCNMAKHMRAQSWPHMLCYIFKTGGKSWLVGNKIQSVCRSGTVAAQTLFLQAFAYVAWGTCWFEMLKSWCFGHPWQNPSEEIFPNSLCH